MAKMRVYELANSLGIEVERALSLLRQVGATPRNHMSVVERVPARRVRQLLKQNKNAALPPTQLPQDDAVAQVDVSQAEPPAAVAPAIDAEIEKKGAPPQQPEAVAPTSPAPEEEQSVAETVQPERQEQTPRSEAAPAVAPAVGSEVPQAPPESAPAESKVKQSSGEQADANRVEAQSSAKEAAPKERPQPAKVETTARPGKQGNASATPAPEGKADTVATDPKRTAQKGTAAPAVASKDAGGHGRDSAGAEERRNAKSTAKRDRVQAQTEARAGADARVAPSKPARGSKGQSVPAPRRSRRSAGRDADESDTTVQEQTSQRRARKRQAAKLGKSEKTPVPSGPVLIPDSLTVNELAELLHVNATSIILKLMEAGVMAAINQTIEYEVAAAVAEKLGFEVTRPKEERVVRSEIEDPDEALRPRPPVVTIMGHVDHGKTTLLDTIRKTKVAQQEAGGITQHIGAYQVEFNGERITFLDTPGHEAFTAMRSRGAQVTDIAVLVVAADDGVMPQTIEAISHARAANVPIIVAINKIDRPGANPDRIKQQLTEHGLVPEDWGGDTVCVEVSALKGEGIDDLLEMILLVAELRELKANPDRPAVGVVIDAELDRSRGPVATVLVQTGTLKVGDPVVVGSVYGRVRAMYDEFGEEVEQAGPSRPVGVIGLSEVPKAGDLLEVVEDDRAARQIAAERAEKERDEARGAGRIRLSEIYSKSQAGEVKDLNLLIKADVQGSVEALRQSIEKIDSPEVRINIIHAAVGGINESDVALAAASDAIIIGFNVRPESAARRAAEREDVEIRLYRVIYEAIEDLEAAIEGMLEPTYEEVVLGRAEVRATFRVPNVGVVAGCYVTEGKIVRNADARLLRDHVIIHEGKLASLKRFKDDVREVNEGYECGIAFERYQDIKEGDIIEAFRMEEVKKG